MLKGKFGKTPKVSKYYETDCSQLDGGTLYISEKKLYTKVRDKQLNDKYSDKTQWLVLQT